MRGLQKAAREWQRTRGSNSQAAVEKAATTQTQNTAVQRNETTGDGGTAHSITKAPTETASRKIITTVD
eukprot:m.7662 g.7662  ORF g.7662 m.7662 type:complete len:69 (+) comp3007_c0_seq1:656-862(+)